MADDLIYAYAADVGRGGFYRVDPVRRTAERLLASGTFFTDVAVDGGGAVYATTFAGLFRVNMETGATALVRSTSGQTNGLFVDAAGARAYLTSSSSDGIEVVDLRTGASLGTVLYGGVGTDGDLLVAGGVATILGLGGSIERVDLASGTVLADAPHGIEMAFGLTVDEGGAFHAYGQGGVHTIAATGASRLLGSLPVPGQVNGASDLPVVRKDGSGASETRNGTVFDDVIALRGGDDRSRAKAGDDVVSGGGGDDMVWGGAGDDALGGGGGADRLRGDAGDDVLSGGGGRDDLRGGAGRDVLRGGGGGDVLDGGSGLNVLTGGGGADVFVFEAGRDLITDFADDEDTLRLDGDLFGGDEPDLGDLLEVARFRHGAVVIDLGGSASLRIAGLDSIPDLLDDLVLA